MFFEGIGSSLNFESYLFLKDLGLVSLMAVSPKKKSMYFLSQMIHCDKKYIYIYIVSVYLMPPMNDLPKCSLNGNIHNLEKSNVTTHYWLLYI